jgi:hypothetical protein
MMIHLSPQDLHGTWNLVECFYHDQHGKRIDYFGAQPTGRLTYGPDGTMSAQLMHDSREAFAHDDWIQAQPEEIRHAFMSYQAYFGRYTLDLGQQMVLHHVEGSLFPNWHLRKITERRFFRLNETKELLHISTPPILVDGYEKVFQVTWEKLY